MRSVSLSKIVSKYLSKSIHFLTAFVYLFTFLGPSLAIATSTLTYTETIQEERVATPLVVTPQTLAPEINNVVTPTEYQRFDLKITPEKSQLRQGVHFRFQNYDTPELSLGTFINSNGPFPHSDFSPLIQKDLQTGFTVSLPGFGQIQCDWDGNLKLVGLHTTDPQADPIALLLSTEGSVELSDVTFTKLTLHAKEATFVKGIKIQEESVFDVETLDLASSGFENTNVMHFLSKTRFVSKKIWRNKGGIIGEHSLFFDNLHFSNLSRVYSKGHLRLISPFFSNTSATFHGDRGTTLTVPSYYFNNNSGGKITSGGLTRLKIGKVTNEAILGNILGKRVILEDTLLSDN
jgi:adhesin HecA-like repeat protein